MNIWIMGLKVVKINGLEVGSNYELREPAALYGAFFGGKNEDIGVGNTYFWDVNL